MQNSTEATAIAHGTSAFLQENGLLMARCGRLESSVCNPEKIDPRRGIFGIFAKGLYLCVSETPHECQLPITALR